MRTEEELWQKYEEQKERAKADATVATAQGVLGSSLRNVGLSILEWVVGISTGEKPTEEEIFVAYVSEIEHHTTFEKGMRAGRIPFLERNLKTAWLGWILGYSEDEIKKHQMQHSVV